MNHGSHAAKIAHAWIWMAAAGFLAGFSCLPSSWYHVRWLLLAGVPALLVVNWRSMRLGLALWPACLFLAWMPVRSSFSAGDSLETGLASTGFLVLWIALIAAVSAGEGQWRRCGILNGHLSAAAAVVSVVWIARTQPWDWEHSRFVNMLVHGGLNPVCTGMIFGFAGLWLCALAAGSRRAGWLWLSAGILHLATFYTGSRGPMLALAGGHLVLLLVAGWRRGMRGALLLLGCAAWYFAATPVLIRMQQANREPPAENVVRAEPVAKATAVMQRAVMRADNGRFVIYRSGWRALGTHGRWGWGIGQWGTRDEWHQHLTPDPYHLDLHLHSAFFATLVHGGLVGALLLLVLLMLAWRAACRAHGDNRRVWSALLAYGCCGLVFDGESLGFLTTQPRFEALLFWLPVGVLLTSRGDGLTDTPPDRHTRA